MRDVSPARRAAFSILRTLEKHGHSDALLRSRSVEVLSDADRKLTTALVLGTLRSQIVLDRCVGPLLRHPNARLDAEVSIALRLGAFQLLYMDRIPARAAIDESVELTKQAGHRFASGMVNAVLRKLAASQPGLIDERLAYPAWMVERWAAFYGDDRAGAICRQGQQPPTIHIRVAGDAVETELGGNGVQLAPGEILGPARKVISGDVTRTSAFGAGRLRVQDEGSQLIAELVPHGGNILDCCAAPGGKTLILAERNPNATIIACEGSHRRLAQLRKRLEMLGERVQFQLVDVSRLNMEAAFDAALVDAPCSGTGTLGRNPEIRHRLQFADLARQAARQKAMLQSALGAVRAGGYLLYSTCSLEPEENEQVVGSVLSESKNARLAPLQSRIEQLRLQGIITQAAAGRLLESITAPGYLRLLPGVFHTDGFFASLIEKIH